MDKVETEELKPCPFCGGEGRLMLPSLPMAADCTDVVVYCTECSICGPAILFDQTTQTADDLPGAAAEAIAAWNKRTPEPLSRDTESGWRDISEAKKDGTVIWAVLRDDIYPGLYPDREDMARWNGRQLPLRHVGIEPDGFDIGWHVHAPVGAGGFTDELIAGWRDLPAPPEAKTP